MSSKIVVPGMLSGTVEVPASKSDGQRALLCAALAEGISVVSDLGSSDDELTMLKIIQDLGRTVTQTGAEIIVSGKLELDTPLQLNANESGLSSRLIIGVAGAFDTVVTITGSGSLLRRSMQFWQETLPVFGVTVQTDAGYLPVTVKGPYRQFEAEVDGSQSSQYISGLIMGLAFSGRIFRLHVRNLVSPNYVRMTLKTMRDFGVEVFYDHNGFYTEESQRFQTANYRVEADWSSAAFWLVAAALGHNIAISRLDRQSLQADIAVLESLKLAGCDILESIEGIHIRTAQLKAFSFDATNCPDLFPILAVLATQCEGKTVLKGVHRLKNKESDRGEAIRTELSKMGANIRLTGNEMQIFGPTGLKGAVLDSHQDHRMAMSLAVAASVAHSPSEICGSECVAKSYPEFWNDWERLTNRH